MESRADKIVAKALKRLQNPLAFRKKVVRLKALVRARAKIRNEL